jgi:ATP-dependent DNA helicase UvrD/PcrA
VLAEAITRLRAGKVIREAGYDGEYGVIRLFEDGELARGGGMLFEAPVARRKNAEAGHSGTQAKPAISESITTSGAAQEPVVIMDSGPRADARDRNDEGILALLDSDQRRAAEIVDGALLILAGPGAGKTRTLTHRIAHLVAERGVAAENCLAVTFTRRAAGEMRERLSELLGHRAEGIAIHTFHSLGLSILREHAEAAGLHRSFRVAGEDERIAMLVEAIAVSENKAGTLLRAISRAKRVQGPTSIEVAEALAAYARALAVRNWIDFDDLIALPVRALSDNAELAHYYRERFRYISVDEFQDIDEQQYRLIALLAPPDANLCVIGDPDQAIYGFRGADASCFARLRRDYAPTTAQLARNYRSSGTIVTASAQMIGSSDDRPVAAIVRDMHERITIHAAPTERAEAEFVVQTIERMIGGHSFFSIDSGRAGRGNVNLSFSDFAVLYRADALSEPLVEALTRSGIPFRKGGQDAPAADDMLASEDLEMRGDRVALLTLHAAKGLEFRVVCIVGIEDGILPLRFGPGDDMLAEERRLFYVGMTRAADHLVLSRAQRRRWRGRVQPLPPSPFLADIEQELLKHQRNETLRRKPEDRQLRLF